MALTGTSWADYTYGCLRYNQLLSHSKTGEGLAKISASEMSKVLWFAFLLGLNSRVTDVDQNILIANLR